MSITPDKSTLEASIPGHLAKYPTPLHIYYEKYLVADARALEEGLKSTLPNAELFYSTKTNSLLPILKALLLTGWGLEVVGPQDHARALEAGLTGEKTLLGGPAWTKPSLEAALFKHGVKSLIIDSHSMAELLGSVLKSNEKIPKLHIALRLHEGESHFGFHLSRENFERAWNFLPKEAIASLGFHIHRNPPGSTRNLEEVSSDFRFRAKQVNLALASLEGTLWRSLVQFADLGGGFDSPFVYRVHPRELSDFHNPNKAAAFREHKMHTRFSLREMAAEVGREVRAELGILWEGKRILFEPGRSVCARALSTLVEVRSVKRDFYPDAQVILTDGNTAILGPLHRNVHQVFSSNEGLGAPTFVYGNLPHSGDWLFQNVNLSAQKTGDRLLIRHTGAYFQPLEANFGHAKPMVVHANRDEVVRSFPG